MPLQLVQCNYNICLPCFLSSCIFVDLTVCLSLIMLGCATLKSTCVLMLSEIYVVILTLIPILST